MFFPSGKGSFLGDLAPLLRGELLGPGRAALQATESAKGSSGLIDLGGCKGRLRGIRGRFDDLEGGYVDIGLACALRHTDSMPYTAQVV